MADGASKREEIITIITGRDMGKIFRKINKLFAQWRHDRKALKESRVNYQNIFNAGTDAFFIIDFTGKIVEVNPSACRMYGYTRQEFMDISIKDLIHPDYFHLFQNIQKTKQPSLFPIESIDLQKDGTEINVEVIISTLKYQGKPHLLSIVRDVTERKRAEQEIESLARFPSENPNPVLRISSDSTILYANKASWPVLDTWKCKVGDTISSPFCQRIEEVFDSGEAISFEFECDNNQVFLVTLMPMIELGYANAYALDLTNRRKMEEKLLHLQSDLENRVHDRTEKLVQSNKKLHHEIIQRKKLEIELLGISESERSRVGQELHDGLGQQLTGIAFLTKVLEQKLKKKSHEEAPDATEIANLINQAIQQARGIAMGLNPVALDCDGLSTALQKLAASTKTLFNVNCSLKCGTDFQIDDPTKAVHLYRITQEAITNAIKHGKAKKIIIELVPNKQVATLKIKNNGILFPEVIVGSKGMGLQIMDYRAETIGGSLNIAPGRRSGTVVTCTFPIKTNYSSPAEKSQAHH